MSIYCQSINIYPKDALVSQSPNDGVVPQQSTSTNEAILPVYEEPASSQRTRPPLPPPPLPSLPPLPEIRNGDRKGRERNPPLPLKVSSKAPCASEGALPKKDTRKKNAKATISRVSTSLRESFRKRDQADRPESDVVILRTFKRS